MHGISLDQVSRVSRPGPMHRTVLARKRLLSMLGTSEVAPHHTNLLEEPFTEMNLVTQRRNERGPAFLLDPFICAAINAPGLYPPVPTREEFATKGLSLDSEGLKNAIKTLLSRAEAPLTIDSLYTGVGNVACFSPAVHKYLLNNCGDDLRKEIQNFFLEGQSLEQASESGQADQSSVGGRLTVTLEEHLAVVRQRDNANKRDNTNKRQWVSAEREEGGCMLIRVWGGRPQRAQSDSQRVQSTSVPPVLAVASFNRKSDP